PRWFPGGVVQVGEAFALVGHGPHGARFLRSGSLENVRRMPPALPAAPALPAFLAAGSGFLASMSSAGPINRENRPRTTTSGSALRVWLGGVASMAPATSPGLGDGCGPVVVSPLAADEFVGLGEAADTSTDGEGNVPVPVVAGGGSGENGAVVNVGAVVGG